MRFVDEVAIYLRSGKGGDGCMSFLREKFRPKGGPDGGDGGRGGNVVLLADRNCGTLLDYRYQQHHRAENGRPGLGKQMYGRKGKDCVLRVPVGTVVYDHESQELIADLNRDGEEVIIARGGQGGRGNMHFATSTNRAPRFAQPGEAAEEIRVRLNLKLLADVGLVGFPNAGKSTLISSISAAKPKVADYPFTTLAPNLGMVRTSDKHSFVVADVPGLIEGAADGAGLGHRFLKHIERVSVLAFLVEPSMSSCRDPLSDYEVLTKELAAYSPKLADKPRVLVFTKQDIGHDEDDLKRLRARAQEEGLDLFIVSSATNEGLSLLTHHFQSEVLRFKAEREAEERAEEEAESEEHAA